MPKTSTLAQPCAILAFTPDHALATSLLAALCRQAGLTVYTAGDDPSEIARVFEEVTRDGARPVLVVHACGEIQQRSAMDCSVQDIEAAWRSLCFSGSQLGQLATERMRQLGSGTLIYIGHVSAVGPHKEDAAYASAQAGLRSLAQSMAREFGAKGVHVAYVMSSLRADRQRHEALSQATAQCCWQLHLQHPSAWTHEIDLRPPALPPHP